MARPKIYDDEELLRIMAELLAWPSMTGVVQDVEAARQAIGFVLASAGWTASTRAKTEDRLVKAFREGRSKRIVAAQAAAESRPPWLRGPQLPTLLSLPPEPEIGQQMEVEAGLRQLATWATDLADTLARHRPADREALAQARQALRDAQKAIRGPDRKNLDS